MTSPWIIAINALIFICLVSFHGAVLRSWLLMLPLFSFPIALLIGAVTWGGLETIGKTLRSRSALDLPNLLAGCTVVSIVITFALSRLFAPEILLENYAAILLNCAGALQLMALVWWFSYSTRQKAAT
jgi:hypothetical protein